MIWNDLQAFTARIFRARVNRQSKTGWDNKRALCRCKNHYSEGRSMHASVMRGLKYENHSCEPLNVP